MTATKPKRMTRTESLKQANSQAWEKAEELESYAFRILELARESRARARFGECDWGDVGTLGYMVERARQTLGLESS